MKQILEVKNVKKSYHRTDVLKDVSFAIYDNEIAILIGLNGAGKSTLVNVICNVTKNFSGEVIFGCKNVGYTPQTPCLFSELSVYENLIYFANIYNISAERVEEVLELCRLSEYRNLLCKNLSGGYKQLCSLAVSILHNPELVIMDEPTSSMDPFFREYFWNILLKLKTEGKSFLIISHNTNDISFCDRLLILENGKIKTEIDKKNMKLAEEPFKDFLLGELQ